jgi:hypothetical protein
MIFQNNTKRLLVYTLTHEEACTEEACTCTQIEHAQTTHDSKSGAKGVRMIPRNVPASLFIPAGASVEAPESALKVSRVKADEAARIISVKKGS